jgi:hypothetical protein
VVAFEPSAEAPDRPPAAATGSPVSASTLSRDCSPWRSTSSGTPVVALSESATVGVPDDVDLPGLQTRLNVLAETGDPDAAAGISPGASGTAAKEISVATQQQRSATEQVVKAMKEVAQVARQTAAGSKQVAGSAEQLALIARDSSQIGQAFRIIE